MSDHVSCFMYTLIWFGKEVTNIFCKFICLFLSEDKEDCPTDRVETEN